MCAVLFEIGLAMTLLACGNLAVETHSQKSGNRVIPRTISMNERGSSAERSWLALHSLQPALRLSNVAARFTRLSKPERLVARQ
jgi:hypothetical protein